MVKLATLGSRGHREGRQRRDASERATAFAPTEFRAAGQARTPGPRPRLAALAHVRAAAGGDDLAHRPAAARAGVALVEVDEELVLEGAARRRRGRGSRRCVAPLASIPAASVSTIAGRERLPLGAGQAAGRPQRMDCAAEQRLVGVDVAHAGDPPLIEQERLDRRAAAARERVQVRGVEAGVEGLEAEARVEEGVERVARRRRAGRCRSAARRRRTARGRRRARSPRGCTAGARPGRRAGSRSCAGAGAGSARRSSSQTRYLPRRPSDSTRRPRSARSIARGAQRHAPALVEHPHALRASAPRTRGASWRRIVSTSGSSGMAPSGYERRPGQVGRVAAGQPAQDATRRRRPAGRRGGARRDPRTPPAAARTRACGRCPAWSGRSRGRPSARAGRRGAAAPATPPTAASISAQRAGEALDVLAVAVDLVGLDEVGEHEPVVELAQQRGRRLDRARVRRAGVRRARRRRRRTAPPPSPPRAPATPASRSSSR